MKKNEPQYTKTINIPENLDSTLDMIGKLYTAHDTYEIELTPEELERMEIISLAATMEQKDRQYITKIWDKYTKGTLDESIETR